MSKSLLTIKFLVDSTTGIKNTAALENAITRFFKSRKLYVVPSGSYGNNTKLLSITPNLREPELHIMEIAFVTDSTVYTNSFQFLHDLNRLFEGAGIQAKKVTSNSPETVILLTKAQWQTEELKPVEVPEPQLSTRFLHKLMQEEEDTAKPRERERLINERYKKLMKELTVDMHLPRQL